MEVVQNVFNEFTDKTYTNAIGYSGRKKMKHLLLRMLEYKNTSLQLIDLHIKQDKKYENMMIQSIIKMNNQQVFGESLSDFTSHQDSLYKTNQELHKKKFQYANLFPMAGNLTKEEQEIIHFNEKTLLSNQMKKFKVKHKEPIYKLLRKKIKIKEKSKSPDEKEKIIKTTTNMSFGSGTNEMDITYYLHTAFNENLNIGGSKITYKPLERNIGKDRSVNSKNKSEQKHKFIFEDDQIKRLKRSMAQIENLGLTIKTEENKQLEALNNFKSNLNKLKDISVSHHKKNLSQSNQLNKFVEQENKFSNVQFLEYEDKTFSNFTKVDFIEKIDQIRNLKHHKKSRSNNFSYKNVQYNRNLPLLNLGLLNKFHISEFCSGNK